MAENQSTIFRERTLERISSPEQLTSYLRVTNPGIWAVLTAAILLLAGIFAWAAVGTLETSVPAGLVVTDHTARIVTAGGETLAGGMPLRVSGQEYTLASTEEDEYGRIIGITEVNLPDGTYEGQVVTEQIHPIEFLLTSR